MSSQLRRSSLLLVRRNNSFDEIFVKQCFIAEFLVRSVQINVVKRLGLRKSPLDADYSLISHLNYLMQSRRNRKKQYRLEGVGNRYLQTRSSRRIDLFVQGSVSRLTPRGNLTVIRHNCTAFSRRSSFQRRNANVSRPTFRCLRLL